MNSFTSDFGKISFKTFEKSDDRSENNRNTDTHYYNDITLNNFKITYFFAEETRDFLLDIKKYEYLSVLLI